MKLAKERFPLISKTERSIATILPKNQKVVSVTIRNTIDELSGLLSSTDPASVTVPEIARRVNRFRQVTIQLQGAASEKMREATRIFSELDEPIIKSEAVLSATRKLVASIDDIEVAAARHAGQQADLAGGGGLLGGRCGVGGGRGGTAALGGAGEGNGRRGRWVDFQDVS